ncbi:MAG TPA: carboxypeptidase-like regulatory domain-containing protein, partial [Terriglobales bacterium]
MQSVAGTLRLRSRWIISALATFLLCLPALAATQQEVRGTVTDRSGAVVARARVVLHATGQNFGRVTQPDGTFVFSGVAADSGTIEVR